MSDGKVGYGKPPKHSRFKKGVSGNPKGRPKRQAPELGDVIKAVLDVTVDYSEGGRTQTASRRELAVRRHLRNALKGDIEAAEALLKIRAQAQKKQGTTATVVEICDLLPDNAPRPKTRDRHQPARKGRASCQRSLESLR